MSIRVPTPDDDEVLEEVIYRDGYIQALRDVAERMKKIPRYVKLTIEELAEWERVESEIQDELEG